MTRKLAISPDLSLPPDAVTSTLVVYGGKGMGKTNFGSVLVEELFKLGLRFSVLDPLDVWWGLQHGHAKGSGGIPVLILGGPHGQLPIEPTGGAVVADLVADEECSTVVVMRRQGGEMWTGGERIRFVTDYCTRLYARQGEKRIPLMQVIDEAGRFCPQQQGKGDLEIAKCIGAIENLVEWGRNVAVGVALITQRSARMNKSVSELADCMVAFRTVGPNSIAAIVDWLGEHVPKARQHEMIEKLRSLDRGTALVVSPGWLRHEGIARIRARETFDSSRTPEPGKSLRAPGAARTPDLSKYEARMAATIEKAKSEDPKALRAKVAQLERDLAAARKAAPATADHAAIEKAVERATATVTRAHLKVLGDLKGRDQRILAALGKVTELVGRSFEGVELPKVAPLQAPVASNGLTRPYLDPPARPRREPVEPSGDLTGPEQRILDAIAWLESIGVDGPEQTAVAFLAGYTYGGGAFNNPRGRLNVKGLVEYLAGERIRLTDEGRGLARAPDAPLTPDELHKKVLGVLPGPEQRLLTPLLTAYPNGMTNEDLAKAAGYGAGGGAYNNPRGRLRSLGLVAYVNGQVRARDLLFPGRA